MAYGDLNQMKASTTRMKKGGAKPKGLGRTKMGKTGKGMVNSPGMVQKMKSC